MGCLKNVLAVIGLLVVVLFLIIFFAANSVIKYEESLNGKNIIIPSQEITSVSTAVQDYAATVAATIEEKPTLTIVATSIPTELPTIETTSVITSGREIDYNTSFDEILRIYSINSNFDSTAKKIIWEDYNSHIVKWTGYITFISDGFFQVKLNVNSLDSDAEIYLDNNINVDTSKLKIGDEVTFIAELFNWTESIPVILIKGEIISIN